MSKPILCLDFDGVCSSYSSGWQGVDHIPDPPVEGLFDFLLEAHKYFSISIYSSRSHQESGVAAMVEWFMHYSPISCSEFPTGDSVSFLIKDENGLYNTTVLNLRFPTYKPTAMITIDDRALTFTGVWPDIDTLRNFKPWNKK